MKRNKSTAYALCSILLMSTVINPISALAAENTPNMFTNRSISTGERKLAASNSISNSADASVSNQSFELTSNTTDVYSYGLGHTVNIGLSGKFTLDESRVSNGQVVKIEDATIIADISGLEANLLNNVETVIKNDAGEHLGELGVTSEGLMLTIDPTYNLRDSLESFTFTNTTALKLQPTQAMIDANKNVIETVQIGSELLKVTYHEQTNYDITQIQGNYTDLSLGSGDGGVGQGFLYRVTFNQVSLTELQNSKGALASPGTLNKGDYLSIYTLSSNIIPSQNSFVVNAYLASEVDNKVKTTRTNGVATPSAGIQIKNLSLSYDDLGPKLSMEQMKEKVIKGIDKTYISKQADGTYLILQNISEKTLTLTNEELSNTKVSPLAYIDPSGQATIDYYSQALENRATYAGVTLGFKYVDPTIINTVTIGMLDPNTGHLTYTTTKDSTPQQVIPEGQARIKIHYVDEAGNPLDTLTIADGWPAEKYDANSKNFEGYSLDKEATSIPGIVLTEADQIAKSEEVSLDYPEAGKVTNLYYVYTKDATVAADVTAKYVDTEGNKISDDVVKTGNIGDKYTTEQKDIAGYTFKEMGKDSAAVSGDFTDKAQTVTYVYTKDKVNPATPTPADNKPSHKEDTPKTEPSSSTHEILPETGENEKMTSISILLGISLVTISLVVSVLRIRKNKK